MYAKIKALVRRWRDEVFTRRSRQSDHSLDGTSCTIGRVPETGADRRPSDGEQHRVRPYGRRQDRRDVGVGQHRCMGVAATGRGVEAMGMDAVRVADGEIAEHWGEFGAVGLLRRMGIVSLKDQA